MTNLRYRSNKLLLVSVVMQIMMMRSIICYAFASSNRPSKKVLSAGRSSLGIMPSSSFQPASGVSFYWGANVRGGDPRFRTGSSSSSQLFGASSSSSSSSSESPSTKDPATTTGDLSLAHRAKECLAIAGSTSMQSFGGIPYLRPSSEDADKCRVIFVLGGPGAGKGTQSELLLKHYPCIHLSAGQLLREETTKSDSPHGSLIEECLVKGQIVPVEISLSLLQTAMRQSEGSTSMVFLVDGFPRNFDNLDGWTRCMKDIAVVWGAFVFQCPLDVLEERILERAKGSGRSDDNLESLRKRFKTFEGDTVPVIETLRLIQDQTSSSLAVADIRADQSLEQVWQDTQQRMNAFIANDVISSNAQLLDAVATQNVYLYQMLCAEEMFTEGKNNDEVSSSTAAATAGSHTKSPLDVMLEQEGSVKEIASSNVCNAKLEFISGSKASVSYDRSIRDATVRETRIWSHQGPKGWRMVHFFRTAIDESP
jgi:UMP-CMP kinase